ncbi:fumarylacetoacetate hydrolase [Auraticoccus sp. F435]|uniref:Fumarylacetoacetate hydrolase n=1 Tax=Auraticoccus cholistanensis TaxID=2656650 RepID=A0A6A9V092_9ACTN|nr:fumarylacetoacetate hydrolase family protein [Auraticoccus cholistanensis]MVA75189.1 fumarylacetoacetate hydrolase [Auraticoccus cholistanensis]
MTLLDDPRDLLPTDVDRATLVGRLLDPELGPCVVAVRGEELVDVSDTFPTVADLLERPDPVAELRAAPAGRSWPLSAVLEATLAEAEDPAAPVLLAPVDLQVLKAAGVTFASSLTERLIEERAGGDPSRAEQLRAELEQVLGVEVSAIRPGSPESERLKADLQPRGLWSQYLEVGLGPDPEIFTKAPVLSAVGCGAAVGVSEISAWNNPEPEVALAVTSTGRIVAATLGNDVNLRDVEGRSALLLPRAKDNNASASVGPFLRLLDEHFTLDDVRSAQVRLQVLGQDDDFVLDGVSEMSQISRDVTELAGHAIGDAHQYPDGLLLYTGTLFAPTADRDRPGSGFTHHPGDVVRITSPRLGTLVNRVTSSETAPRWEFGLRALIRHLHRRGLTDRVGTS